MKQVIVGILFSASCCCAFAQSEGEVKLEGINIQKAGENVEVSFKAYINKKATRQNYKLVLTPILYKGGFNKALKPIVVETRTTKIMDERERIAMGKLKKVSDEFKTANGSEVNYVCKVDYEDWMNGGSIRMDRHSYGCCDEASFAAIPIATDLALVLPPPPVKEEIVIAKTVPVVRKWKFSKEDMIIDFSVSRTVIDFTLFENRRTLEEILAAIQKIKSSSGTQIDKIEIIGYASPEGAIKNNHRLAEERSKALQTYIQKEILFLPDSVFELKNGGENWMGLRTMVEASDMKYKKEILDIIDNVPVEIDYVKDTSRKKMLMDLKGGIPYNYMLNNFFPKLRNACYIGVYYLDDDNIQE